MDKIEVTKVFELIPASGVIVNFVVQGDNSLEVYAYEHDKDKVHLYIRNPPEPGYEEYVCPAEVNINNVEFLIAKLQAVQKWRDEQRAGKQE